MAIKMAKGSLFAFLLRSPWWYSILIGLFVLVVSLLVTDAQYIVLSFTGALPFFGIGSFAGYKQFQQPSAKRVLEVIEQAKKLSSTIVAQKIAANYLQNSYKSDVFKGNAAEIELSYGHQKILLCTKRFKAAKTGIEPLKLLVSAGEKVEATGYLYLSLGEITDTARNYADENKIELIEANRFAALFDGKAKID
jgi:restriction system protein